VDCGKTGCVVARETHVALQGIHINFHAVAQLFKVTDAALECRFVPDSARGGIDVDVFFHHPIIVQ
jgi:hypothetical protein